MPSPGRIETPADVDCRHAQPPTSMALMVRMLCGVSNCDPHPRLGQGVRGGRRRQQPQRGDRRRHEAHPVDRAPASALPCCRHRALASASSRQHSRNTLRRLSSRAAQPSSACNAMMGADAAVAVGDGHGVSPRDTLQQHVHEIEPGEHRAHRLDQPRIAIEVVRRARRRIDDVVDGQRAVPRADARRCAQDAPRTTGWLTLSLIAVPPPPPRAIWR